MEYNAAVRLFDRYLEGELTEVQRKALEEYLEKDEACAAELDRYRRVHDVVHRYFETVRPGEGFLEDVMVGVEEIATPKNKRKKSRARTVAVDDGGGRKSPLLWVLPLIVVLGAGAWFAFFRTAPSTGVVLFVNGVAERGPLGSAKPLRQEDSLATGDELRADRGDLRIQLSDRTEITVTDGASFRVGSVDGAGARHEALAGTTRYTVFDGEDRFAVEFSAGRARVAESKEGEARFAVVVPERDSEATSVEVTRGAVRVATERGDQLVGEGMKSNVRRGAAPSQPVPIHAARREPRGERTRPDRDVTRRTSDRAPSPPPRQETDPTPAGASIDETIAKLQDPGAGTEAHLAALARLDARFVGDKADAVSALLRDIVRNEPDDTVRSAAFGRLVELAPDAAFEDAVDVLQNDSSVELRKKALQVLVSRPADPDDDPDAVRIVLLDTLGQSFSPDLVSLQLDLLREIAKIGNPDDVFAVLGVANRGDEIAVRKAALDAAGGFKSADAVDGLMEFLRDPEPDLRGAAAAGLRKLTGQSMGFDPAADEALREEVVQKWEAWWAENRGTFEF